MVVAQLVEWSHPTPEIRGSNLVIRIFYFLSTEFEKLCLEDEKMPGNRFFCYCMDLLHMLLMNFNHSDLMLEVT